MKENISNSQSEPKVETSKLYKALENESDLVASGFTCI